MSDDELGPEIGRFPSSDLAPGMMRFVPHPPYGVLVANVAGELFAIEDACPHSGAGLCGGTLEGAIVTCPGHGWRLDVRSGEVLTAIGRGEANPTFVVRVVEGDAIVYSASSSARS